MADQSGNVEARRVTLKSLEVTGVALPVGQFHVRVEETEEETGGLVGSDSHPTVTNHIGRYPLHDLEVHLGG